MYLLLCKCNDQHIELSTISQLYPHLWPHKAIGGDQRGDQCDQCKQRGDQCDQCKQHGDQ